MGMHLWQSSLTIGRAVLSLRYAILVCRRNAFETTNKIVPFTPTRLFGAASDAGRLCFWAETPPWSRRAHPVRTAARRAPTSREHHPRAQPRLLTPSSPKTTATLHPPKTNNVLFESRQAATVAPALGGMRDTAAPSPGVKKPTDGGGGGGGSCGSGGKSTPGDPKPSINKPSKCNLSNGNNADCTDGGDGSAAAGGIPRLAVGERTRVWCAARASGSAADAGKKSDHGGMYWPARIKSVAQGGSVLVEYDDGVTEQVHHDAVVPYAQLIAHGQEKFTLRPGKGGGECWLGCDYL